MPRPSSSMSIIRRSRVVAVRRRRRGLRGLRGGAPLIGCLDPVVDGVADDMDQLGPEALPLLRIDAHAAAVHLDLDRALAQALRQRARMASQPLQRPLRRLQRPARQLGGDLAGNAGAAHLLDQAGQIADLDLDDVAAPPAEQRRQHVVEGAPAREQQAVVSAASASAPSASCSSARWQRSATPRKPAMPAFPLMVWSTRLRLIGVAVGILERLEQVRDLLEEREESAAIGHEPLHHGQLLGPVGLLSGRA